MGARRDVDAEIEFAIRRHFSAVFTEQERVALVARIREWDDRHPDLDRQQRLGAWLEFARAQRAAAGADTVVAAAH